jgi:hypothetical protein
MSRARAHPDIILTGSRPRTAVTGRCSAGDGDAAAELWSATSALARPASLSGTIAAAAAVLLLTRVHVGTYSTYPRPARFPGR